MKNHTQIKLFAKTRSELAAEYGVSRRTFYKWIKREGLVLPKGLIPPLVVQAIYDKFGSPFPDSQNCSSRSIYAQN